MRHARFAIIGFYCSVISVAASAQNEVGNGGSGIRCEVNGSPRVELLDLFEARELYSPPDLGDGSLSVQQKIDLALDRLARVDPLRAERYRQDALVFQDGSITMFRDGMVLTHVDDAMQIGLPAGCDLVQISVFRRPILPGDKTFVVDARLWREMDVDSRATLILHEIIYREAAWELRHTNSLRVRRLISSLVSRDFDHLSVDAYRDVMAQLGLNGFDMTRGTKFVFGSTEVDAGGRLAKGTLLSKQRVGLCPDDLARNVAPLFRSGSVLEFHPNGVLKAGVSDDLATYPVYGGLTAGLRGRMSFHDNCQVATGSRFNSAIDLYGVDGRLRSVEPGHLAFDRLGYVLGQP